MYVCREAVLSLLQDIKTLWDKHGVGDDDAESEPIYRRLERAIAELEGRE